jgi:hypothetical protein
MESLNLQYIFYQLYTLSSQGAPVDAGTIVSWIAYYWAWFTIVSLTFSAVFLVITIYAYRKLHAIEHIVDAQYHTEGVLFEEKRSNSRWAQVEKHLESENQNDWRLAIIEADIMLDELVKSMGYQGDSLGERLKGVEQSDFTTIDAAWEAHKVRNQIAHAGSDFILTQREARRVLALYRQVFQEFQYI